MATTPGDFTRQKEARLLFAKHAIQNQQVFSTREAAVAYEVPESTLRTRLQGVQPIS